MSEQSFNLEKHQVRRAFARAARDYERAAVLQRDIGARLLARLDVIKLKPRRILDLGCGTGFCAHALRRRYRKAEVLGLDIAPAMLKEALNKSILDFSGHAKRKTWFSLCSIFQTLACLKNARPSVAGRNLGLNQRFLKLARCGDGWFKRVRWVGGDAECLPFADGGFDMVLSNLTLQWCDPDRVFGEVARVLRPGGVFMFTSFGPDTLRELRHAWAAVDGAPHVHGFIDMHDLGDALVRARLAEPVMDVDRMTLTYKDVMSLMRELKDIGAHNVARGRSPALTGKARFARFRAAYEDQARDGRIPATYEVVYGQAWGPPAAHAGVAVPLTQLRRPGR